ncbi:hypothetical protein HZH68_006951 [Vespula germanica]|uniref:Uncharacterized protein n=1 Tax=Vespula germanica TaxID=30212 RepID=A0A834KC35_VESGE|nr:hypothetical protein HZH68_006951 [Vespula germanica]
MFKVDLTAGCRRTIKKKSQGENTPESGPFLGRARGGHYIVVNIVTTPLLWVPARDRVKGRRRMKRRAGGGGGGGGSGGGGEQELTTSNYVIAEELLTEPVSRPVIQ